MAEVVPVRQFAGGTCRQEKAGCFTKGTKSISSYFPQQDMQDMYSEAIGKGAKFLEAPVSGSKVRRTPIAGANVKIVR